VATDCAVIAAEKDMENAFAAGQQSELPVVYGEWVQEGFYHYYPKIEQVKDWGQLARFHLMDETVGDEYHHFLIQRP
jgi:hypothetical protein